ncbi:MAG: FAD-dependent oxidoreductase [Acidimicrobiales bacterium]
MKIAVIGTGISGLASAHYLNGHHDVTVFEADRRPGGHSNTVRVDLADETHLIDTGFIVYNETTYPGLTTLFRELSIATQPSEMSFSVTNDSRGLYWRGSSLDTVFAQRSNIGRPAFLRMLVDVARFNRLARAELRSGLGADVTLDQFLGDHSWSDAFRDTYLLPLGSSIWSADPAALGSFPASSFLRFLDNHGLLSARNPVQWRTVTGGSTNYVTAITRRLGRRVRLGVGVDKIVRTDSAVEIHRSDGDNETFDAVVLATHSDDALRLLSDASHAEQAVLGAIGYQPNVATVHTDVAMLPPHRRAWASWNCHIGPASGRLVEITYLLNRLQSVPSAHALCVTLNREHEIDPAKIIMTMEYAHPVFHTGAFAAQHRWSEINGRRRTWFAGAYWGNGFHEDGLQSALRVCRALGVAV